MSAHEEQPNEASEADTAEWIDEVITEFSSNLIEETIKANLEPLYAQISTLTQMMNKMIKDNSARSNPTASFRDDRFPSESPLTDGAGTSSILPSTSLVTAAYSRIIHILTFLLNRHVHTIACLVTSSLLQIAIRLTFFTVELHVMK